MYYIFFYSACPVFFRFCLSYLFRYAFITGVFVPAYCPIIQRPFVQARWQIGDDVIRVENMPLPPEPIAHIDGVTGSRPVQTINRDNPNLFVLKNGFGLFPSWDERACQSS